MKQLYMFPAQVYIPYITIKGKWLENAGFEAGKKIRVCAEDGRLIITNNNKETDSDTVVLDGIVEKEYQKIPSQYQRDYRGYTVSLRLERDSRYDPVRLYNSYDVYNFLSPLQHESREIMLSVMLNAKNFVVGVYEGGKGSSIGAAVYPAEVIKAAIMSNSSALILAHNHPSGVTDPSVEDIGLTQQIINAAKLMSIVVHDHIIIGYNTYRSMRDSGCLPNAQI